MLKVNVNGSSYLCAKVSEDTKNKTTLIDAYGGSSFEGYFIAKEKGELKNPTFKGAAITLSIEDLTKDEQLQIDILSMQMKR